MNKKQIIRLLCLNLGIIAWNVLLFSPGLIGLSMGAGALFAALGVTDIVMSLIGFAWGNYSLLFAPKGEMKFTKFQSTVDSVQDLFYGNLKKMLKRIIIFDYNDYLKVLEKLNNAPITDGVKVAPKSHADQLKIYNEHIDYVHGIIEMNDSMLVKMDSLLLEISKLDDIDVKGLENIAAIREINELISQTKFYKN